MSAPTGALCYLPSPSLGVGWRWIDEPDYYTQGKGAHVLLFFLSLCFHCGLMLFCVPPFEYFEI